MADSNRRLVYSTDGGEIKHPKEQKADKGKGKPKKATAPKLSADNKTVYVERDRKGRGGKTVTVVSNLQLAPDKAEALLKTLKAQVGAGGAIKEGNLEIQGDHREKVMAYLQKEGYSVKAKGG